MKNIFIILASTIFLLGCQSAINKAARNTKYSVYEVVGIEKRDLFKKQVGKVKDGQEETGESFKDALDKLKEVYAFDGGKLEKRYRSLNSAYEEAEEDAKDVEGRIAQLDTIAQDLFSEWKKEIQEIKTASLKNQSQQKLNETESKYRAFFNNLKSSEAKMKPVLGKLRDQVLFIKHNLNAKAIAGLKTESLKIQGEIESLIQEMNVSIEQADQVIKEI